jgi:hypothetical protein
MGPRSLQRGYRLRACAEYANTAIQGTGPESMYLANNEVRGASTSMSLPTIFRLILILNRAPVRRILVTKSAARR